MTNLELILNILSTILIEIFVQMIIAYLYPKFKKKENEDEELAKSFKYVKMNNNVVFIFIILCIFTSLIGLIIFILPSFIINVLKLNYIATILIWWIPLIFNDITLYFMLTKVKYNEEEIIVKKPLSKQKVYKFNEIIKYSNNGNLKIKTKNGNFILFKAMSGTNSLRKTIKEKLN